MIRVNKKITKLKKKNTEEDSFVDLSPAERVGFMWELTEEVWSLKDPKIAQQRLQRHITKLHKK